MSARQWDAVIVAGTNFGGRPPLGDWQLARALARRHRVLYVQPPIPAHRYRAVDRPWPPAQVTREDDGDLYVLRTLGLPGHNRPWISPAANRMLGAAISKAAKRLLGPRPVIITFDPKRGLVSGVKRSVLLYWQRDRLVSSANTRYPRHMLALHKRLLRHADLVTAVSTRLANETRPDRANVTVINNGCDIEHFASPPMNAVRPRARHKVTVGYIGGVSWRVDMNLLADLARTRPQWDIVLAGEVTTPPPAVPNIRLAGACSYDELPRVVRTFDVGIVPYRMNEFNQASYPLKVLEYLACGVPVVATPLPALKGLGPFVRDAQSATGFAAAIEEQITNGPRPEACQRLAAAHSWDSKARELETLVDARLSSTNQQAVVHERPHNSTTGDGSAVGWGDAK